MRRLIVNADDFGRSHSINRAVIEAHQRGILTTASLMVNGDAAVEAVALAKENPRLGVGLHLSLICGTSALPCSEIPALVDRAGNFSDNPVMAGMRYFFSPACRQQLGAEIAAQFARFRETGLLMDHVNGHLHFHMHPTVFGILCRNTRAWGIERMRLTRDPFWLNVKLGRGRWLYRLSHAIIFGLLAATQRGKLQYLKVKSTARVFGLLQNALVDEAFVRGLLPLLPEGDSELYSHPSLDEFKNEFDALTNSSARAEIDRLGIELIRYSDLQ